jgi:uncharacterized coiled-coil protein SlyX
MADDDRLPRRLEAPRPWGRAERDEATPIESPSGRDRISSLELRLAALQPAVDGLGQRVIDLEGKASEMWRILSKLEISSALQTQMLEQLVRTRQDDVSRVRALFSIVIPLLSIGVAVIALVTR